MENPTLADSTEFTRHVRARLDDESLIWLTTIGRTSGAPIPSVVWFLWNGAEVLILSEPDKPKLRNIDANPAVALNLQAGAGGDDVAVLSGAAAYDRNGPTDDIVRIGFTEPAAFRDAFSELIRVTPNKVRGFL